MRYIRQVYHVYTHDKDELVAICTREEDAKAFLPEHWYRIVREWVSP